MDNEQVRKPGKNKVYIGIIIVLVVAIAVVGGLLIMKEVNPGSKVNEITYGEPIGEGTSQGGMVYEFNTNEDGSVDEGRAVEKLEAIE